MKQYIYINYGFVIDKIYNKKGEKYFFIDNNKILIIEFKGNHEHLEKLFLISNFMFDRGIKVNTFLLNNNNRFYCIKDDIFIILMKINDYVGEVNLDDLMKFFYINLDIKDYNVLDVWEKEVDLIEKELLEYNNEFQMINNSINYFIGMGENAIQLLSNYKNELSKRNDSVGHLVSYKKSITKVINDTFSFIKVNKMYDVSNYIKFKFIKNELNYGLLDYIFSYVVNDEFEGIYLYSCLLYPNLYFSMVKDILLKKENESKMGVFINNINEYRKLLLYCKNNLSKNKSLFLLEWLNK